MLSKTQVGLLLGGVIVGSIATKVISDLISNKKLAKKEHKNKQPNEQDFNSQHYQDIKNQQLARVIKFFGEEKFSKLEKATVIVFGVGGVGSHVVNMLARSGVGRIKIVDFDRVTLSSLNRHAFGMQHDVGHSKVHCIKDYISKILPHIKIDIVQTYVTVENAASFFDQPVDYVIDCIDNLDAKVELIALCKEKNINLIVSGGAGMKSDPTRLQIRDISDVKYDSLITRLRKQLMKKGIKSGVKVVFSYEQTTKQLLPLNQEQVKNPDSFKVFDNYRVRIIPVLGTMPAIVGMAIASYVLCDLAGEKYNPFETDYIKNAVLNKIYCELINDEKKNGVNLKNLEVDMEEVALLAKEVYEWRCLITDKKEGNTRLLRWNPEKQATLDNLALMGKEQYEKHLTLRTLQEINKFYPQQILARYAQKSSYGVKLWKSGYKVFI